MLGEAERFCPRQYLYERHPGVRIEEMELPGGLQGCVDHEQRIIWIATGLTRVQRRCTIAYELGQLRQGPTPTDPYLAAAHRRAAEDWAARMLIPTAQLLDGFRCCSDIPSIAEGLGVDTPTLRARLRNLTDEEQDALLDVIRGMRPVA